MATGVFQRKLLLSKDLKGVKDGAVEIPEEMHPRQREVLLQVLRTAGLGQRQEGEAAAGWSGGQPGSAK